MKKYWLRTLGVCIIVALLTVTIGACTNQNDENGLENMDMLQKALTIIDEHYIDAIDVDKLDTVAAIAVIESLDKFTYVTETQYSQSSNSNLGMSVHISTYNEYFITDIVEGWPAATVFEDGFSLQRGDEIYGLTNSTLTDDDGNPIFYRLRGLSRSYFEQYTAGGTGTTLTLRVMRGGSLMGDYAFTKQEGYLPRAHFVSDIYGDGSKVGYIQLKSFTYVEMPDGTVKSTADDFDDCMAQFKESGMTKLILDLRGNGGGSTSILSKIAAYFVPVDSDGTTEILRLEYAKEPRVVSVNVKQEDSEKYMPDLPVVILCDGSTASAAEALIGACRAYHTELTTVVGTDTYGKGVFQSSDIELYDNTKMSTHTKILDKYYVVMVSGYYYIVDPSVSGGKYCIHENPLHPDIVITPNESIGTLTADAEIVAAKVALSNM